MKPNVKPNKLVAMGVIAACTLALAVMPNKDIKASAISKESVKNIQGLNAAVYESVELGMYVYENITKFEIKACKLWKSDGTQWNCYVIANGNRYIVTAEIEIENNIAFISNESQTVYATNKTLQSFNVAGE